MLVPHTNNSKENRERGEVVAQAFDSPAQALTKNTPSSVTGLKSISVMSF